MFEQAFKNIDDVLCWKEAGCTTELDYTEQTSWLLFLKYLSGRLNNANVFKVNRLFFNIGIPSIMNRPEFHCQKFTNAKVRSTLNGIVSTRNEIAHGDLLAVRKTTAVQWRGCIERIADRVDGVVSQQVQTQTGGAALW